MNAREFNDLYQLLIDLRNAMRRVVGFRKRHPEGIVSLLTKEQISKMAAIEREIEDLQAK